MKKIISDKYYTPELSEFYVGNTLESRSPTYEDEFSEVSLVAEFGNDGVYHSNIEHEIAMYIDGAIEYRVKYLDKQDIESCGFEHVASANFDDFYRHIKTKIGLFVPKGASTFINIVIAEDFLIKHIDIKNINEFRKLLKQLGI